MRTFFTRERFGSPQVIAAFLLLVYLLQCLWLASRELRSQVPNAAEQERIQAGLLQWRGKGIAGIDRPAASVVLPNDGFDANRSPLWYLIAAAPLAATPEALHSTWSAGWLSRIPYLIFGLLLGASLWYVSRRLFGNAGGYIALTFYCFSPAMILTASGGPLVEPEIGGVWGAFGAIFTAIAVAHTLYAPREVILWNWRRIFLLGLSFALAVGCQFSFAVLLPLTLAFMLWVAPTRRGAAVVIWAAAICLGGLLMLASYGLHPGLMWESLRHANLFSLSRQALTTGGVYLQLGSFIARSSPSLLIALPVALATYVFWRRSRYFGNTAPLLVAGLFLFLGISNPHFPGAGFHLAAIAFLFTFVAGVAADLLETRQRPVVAAGLVGLLSASALWNIVQLSHV